MEYGAELNDILLPVEVMQWAGLDKSCPEVDPASLPEGAAWGEEGLPSLANLNDGGTSFTVIADIIDAQF